MNNFELTRQDTDQLVRNFRNNPNADDYHRLRRWYLNNIGGSDPEYMVCMYLFLLGANIKNGYEPMTRDQHREYVREIRDLIEGADPIVRAQRKAYLDCGTKYTF